MSPSPCCSLPKNPRVIVTLLGIKSKGLSEQGPPGAAPGPLCALGPYRAALGQTRSWLAGLSTPGGVCEHWSLCRTCSITSYADSFMPSNFYLSFRTYPKCPSSGSPQCHVFSSVTQDDWMYSMVLVYMDKGACE